jgi:hypothetical protein
MRSGEKIGAADGIKCYVIALPCMSTSGAGGSSFFEASYRCGIALSAALQNQIEFIIQIL